MRVCGVLLTTLAFAVLVTPGTALAWTWPVTGPVLQPFRLADDPYVGGQHRGIDVGAPLGTPVVAPSGGLVTFAGTVPRWGKTVSIETSDGYVVTLLGLGGVVVSRGDAVLEGGVVGQIGPSVEPGTEQSHVQLGIRVAAEEHGYLDPLAFLPANATPAPAAATATQPEPPRATSETASPVVPDTSLPIEPALPEPQPGPDPGSQSAIAPASQPQAPASMGGSGASAPAAPAAGFPAEAAAADPPVTQAEPPSTQPAGTTEDSSIPASEGSRSTDERSVPTLAAETPATVKGPATATAPAASDRQPPVPTAAEPTAADVRRERARRARPATPSSRPFDLVDRSVLPSSPSVAATEPRAPLPAPRTSRRGIHMPLPVWVGGVLVGLALVAAGLWRPRASRAGTSVPAPAPAAPGSCVVEAETSPDGARPDADRLHGGPRLLLGNALVPLRPKRQGLCTRPTRAVPVRRACGRHERPRRRPPHAGGPLRGHLASRRPSV